MINCYQDQMLDLEQAQQQILDTVTAVQETEVVSLSNSRGRVLAKDTYAPVAVPPHKNSAMDGYAIACPGSIGAGASFTVVGRSMAGVPYTGEIANGQAIRIMTGACVPEGVDTVIMQEHVQSEGDGIVLQQKVNPGQNVRHAGEDVEQGALVYSAGRKISALDLGVLASIGCAELEVYRPLKVALFCTGDELKQPDELLALGDIYNSNRFMMFGLLEELGMQVVDLGVVPDSPEALEKTLQQAAQVADAIISTGGVSVGDADYVKSVMQKAGEIGFWKVAIKPGKPFAFGRFQGCHFFGLPGNPVSSAVTFKLLAVAALQKMSGQAPRSAVKIKAIAAGEFKKRAGRQDFQRGILSEDEQGRLTVVPASGQGSHQLFALANADALVCLPKQSSGVVAGELVEVWLL